MFSVFLTIAGYFFKKKVKVKTSMWILAYSSFAKITIWNVPLPLLVSSVFSTNLQFDSDLKSGLATVKHIVYELSWSILTSHLFHNLQTVECFDPKYKYILFFIDDCTHFDQATNHSVCKTFPQHNATSIMLDYCNTVVQYVQ